MEDPAVCDWSGLPVDVLAGVLALLEIPDIFSSGAVCRSWNEAYLAVRRRGLFSRRQQSPCLLYFSIDHGPDVATLHRLITGSRPYHVALSPADGDDDATTSFVHPRHVVGCSHGWLVAADLRCELHLENPVTRRRIAMPPANTLVVFNPRLDWSSPKTMDDVRRSLYVRAILSSDPGDSSCTVLLINQTENYLSFARPGDPSWTMIQEDIDCQTYHDCMYDATDCMFYAVRSSGEVHAIFLNAPDPVVSSIFPPISCKKSINCTKYIARAPWGDLLQIWRKYGYTNGRKRTYELTVYKVDMVEEKLHEINELQGNALFIGFNESFFVAAKDFPGLAPNCVYLAHDRARNSHKSTLQEVVVFDIQDGSFRDFMPAPNAWLKLPPPIWIRPSNTL
ncbi:hypothetical protein EJB05_56189, partial [Eragrostis curvula]